MPSPPYQWQVMRANLDPVMGSEQAGQRPVLIVSDEVLNRVLPVVGVVALTTYRGRRSLFPTEVLLPGGTAGLPLPSVVLAYQVRTISKDRLMEPYGVLEDEELRAAVREALRRYLDLG